MVLVLAAGQPGAFDQVHDFANYPARERFVGPHFEGSVGYRMLPEGGVALRAERVLNPRAVTNLSGSLALQLWALAEPYRLRIVKATEGTTIESLATESSIKKYPVQQLRLINKLYPEGEPKPGDYVKTVK